jgi:hypothetical protein
VGLADAPLQLVDPALALGLLAVVLAVLRLR